MTTPALEYTAQVTNGKLPAWVSEQIAAVIRRMEGKKLVISIREWKRRRSNPQNRYYFGVCVKMITHAFREAGNAVDGDDVHEFLKAEVGKLSQVIFTPDGEVLKAPGSTRKLNTQEMEVYLEQVRAWAADVLDIRIPLPKESGDVMESTMDGDAQ